MIRTKASAAIMTVLILGAVASIVSVFMIMQTTDNIVLTKVIREGKIAEYAATACVEIALEKLRVNQSYTGNESVSIDTTTSCNIDTVTFNSGIYSIATHSTVGESTKNIRVQVSVVSQYFKPSSWKEQQN